MRLTARRLLATSLALPFASPALAGDVVVKLGAGDGFVVEDSTGSEELLRVDQAPDADVSAQRLIIDDSGAAGSTNAALTVTRPGTNSTMVLMSDDSQENPAICMAVGTGDEGEQTLSIDPDLGYHSSAFLVVSGQYRANLDANGNCPITNNGLRTFDRTMFYIGPDVPNAIGVGAAQFVEGRNAITIFNNEIEQHAGIVFGYDGRMLFFEGTDLAASVNNQFDSSAETMTAQSGTPYSGVAVGDYIYISNRGTTTSRGAESLRVVNSTIGAPGEGGDFTGSLSGDSIVVASTISGGAAGFGSMCAFVVAVAIHVEEMPS